MSRPLRYDRISIALHWTLASLVTAMIPLGLVLARLPFPGEAYDRVHLWHRSLGEITFVLTLALLWWRSRRAPVPPFDDVPWRRSAAARTHGLLLALLAFLAVTKILRGAVGIGWSFADWHIDAPFAPNGTVSGPLSTAHDLAGYALIGLTGFHIAAVVWHALIPRDGVWKRMIPGV